MSVKSYAKDETLIGALRHQGCPYVRSPALAAPEDEDMVMGEDARLALVEEHVGAENRRDLDAVMATFGPSARYEDGPWGDYRHGRDGVRSYYTELLRALPDLSIDIQSRHVASDSIVLEVTVRGTHLGAWRGLPATRRRVEFPLCAVYTFEPDGRLSGERIYYDRATVLRQLGVFREPTSVLGRLVIALTHPVTIVRAYTSAARARGRRNLRTRVQRG